MIRDQTTIRPDERNAQRISSRLFADWIHRVRLQVRFGKFKVKPFFSPNYFKQLKNTVKKTTWQMCNKFFIFLFYRLSRTDNSFQASLFTKLHVIIWKIRLCVLFRSSSMFFSIAIYILG